MKKKRRVSTTQWWRTIGLGLALASGCAHGQRGQYEELTRDLRRVAPTSAAPGRSDAPIELTRGSESLEEAICFCVTLWYGPSLCTSAIDLRKI